MLTFSQPRLVGLSSGLFLCVRTHKFRVPTKGTLKTKIFWPIKGFWLSSEAKLQTKMDKNDFFKAVNPIPI